MPLSEQEHLDRLRRRAERKLQDQTERLQDLSKQDMARLVHELGTHQIELELQNEELCRAQEEFEEARRKYADLYDFAPVGYLTLDLDGVIIEANRTAGSMLERNKRSLISRPFSSYIVRRDHDIFAAHMDDVLKKRTRQSCEVRLKRLRGGTFHAELQSIIVEDHEPPLYVRTVIIDISRRKRVEEALRESKELSDAVNQINAVIFSTLDFGEIMHRVIEEVVKAAGADSAVIYMPEGNLWVARYVYGLPGFEGTRITADDIKYSVRAVKERRPVVINNIPANEEICHTRIVQGYGVKALLDAPLIAGEDVIGNFALYSHREGEVFNERHIDFFNKVSASVSLAVKNAHLFKSLQESEHRYRTLFNAIDEGFCIIEVMFDEHEKPVDYRFLEINPSFEKQTGLIDAQGKRMRELAPKHEEYWFETYGNIALTGQPVRFQSRAEQLQRWFDVYAFRFGQPEDRQVAVLFNDITERKRIEEEIKHMAHHDALTGLPNRRLFIDIITFALAEARRHKKRLALLFLDLDRFKEVNDTLGHEAGDELLKHVSVRLKAVIRRTDTIARIGGDEFNIVLTDIARGEDAGDVARKIVESFQKPFSIAGKELHITTSIGISIYPDDTDDIDILFRCSDMAMYHAKETGRNTYQFYNPAINTRSLERMRLEGMLRRTIEGGELVVYYQPQVSIETRQMICAEALVRWRHPEQGMLDPKHFIPLAEETGIIAAIDEWVLRTACTQCREWQESGIPGMCVTVNLSAEQFQKTDLVERISLILKETGLEPNRLDLEITESTAMKSLEQTIHNMNRLAEIGVRISIDDFGTGYSSLSYLKKLPIQKLKIDQSFVRDIATDPDDRAIISAVTAVAQNMKLRVIAEGVETEEQFEFLKSIGCQEIQGFFFSKPLPADEFRELIANGK
ncbi:MAG: EAL domain-containing protein [Nitrospirota bacterium]